MSDNICEDLLRDTIFEINEIAKDKTIWEETDFYRGYRAGMMVVMKAIKDELSAFGLENDKRFPLIDIDKWFSEGKDYQVG